jgi:hypothetical protein
VQLLHQRAQAAQRQPVVRVPSDHRRAHLQGPRDTSMS